MAADWLVSHPIQGTFAQYFPTASIAAADTTIVQKIAVKIKLFAHSKLLNLLEKSASEPLADALRLPPALLQPGSDRRRQESAPHDNTLASSRTEFQKEAARDSEMMPPIIPGCSRPLARWMSHTIPG